MKGARCAAATTHDGYNHSLERVGGWFNPLLQPVLTFASYSSLVCGVHWEAACVVLAQVLNNACCSHTSADTHRYQPVATTASLQFIEQ